MEPLALEEAKHFSVTLGAVLRQVLKEFSSPDLPGEFCKGLLEGRQQGAEFPPHPHTHPHREREEGEGEGEAWKEQGRDDDDDVALSLVRGYPDSPLCHRLVSTLAFWMVTGECPPLHLPAMYLLNEETTLDLRQQRLDEVSQKLVGASSLWEDWSDDERQFFLKDVLNRLGVRGVLDLLGVRETVGSASLLPPSKEKLIQAFETPHSPSSKLTVGARALSKHHHRDDTAKWWGTCTGTEVEKNAHALGVLTMIMSNATWINIHTLPHDVKVVEMRTIEGYGARWLHDATEFRGFLEPQMLDGHTTGWKH